MASLRDISWREDVRLQEDLRTYVRQNMKRKEMLDFLKRDFPTYAWSIPTLDRRLRYFNIFYTDTNVTLDEVKEAVGKELEGQAYSFLEVKLLRLRRKTKEDKYDNCDKNQPTVLANSSNNSRARRHTVQNASKQHIHSKCCILSVISKYLET